MATATHAPAAATQGHIGDITQAYSITTEVGGHRAGALHLYGNVGGGRSMLYANLPEIDISQVDEGILIARSQADAPGERVEVEWHKDGKLLKWSVFDGEGALLFENSCQPPIFHTAGW